MVSKKMAAALNKHLNAELYSSYLYLSMSGYASHKGLKGVGHWLYIQAQEEMIHVKKMYDYIDDQGAQVILEAIDKPPAKFGTMLGIFEAVLKHEEIVTDYINKLMSQALKENDHATETFLQWFVTEQTEEEKSAKDIIDKLNLAGETGPAAYMIDTELATRILTLPPL